PASTAPHVVRQPDQVLLHGHAANGRRRHPSLLGPICSPEPYGTLRTDPVRSAKKLRTVVQQPDLGAVTSIATHRPPVWDPGVELAKFLDRLATTCEPSGVPTDEAAPLTPTDRTSFRRKRERGSHDRDLMNSILDEALVAHVGFVA